MSHLYSAQCSFCFIVQSLVLHCCQFYSISVVTDSLWAILEQVAPVHHPQVVFLSALSFFLPQWFPNHTNHAQHLHVYQLKTNTFIICLGHFGGVWLTVEGNQLCLFPVVYLCVLRLLCAQMPALQGISGSPTGIKFLWWNVIWLLLPPRGSESSRAPLNRFRMEITSARPLFPHHSYRFLDAAGVSQGVCVSRCTDAEIMQERIFAQRHVLAGGERGYDRKCELENIHQHTQAGSLVLVTLICYANSCILN